MYARTLFLLFLMNTLGVIASVEEAEKSPKLNEKYSLHWIVKEVARGHFADIKSAKKIMEELLQTQNLNKEKNKKTAAQLSAHYCIVSPCNFEDQLSILKLLLYNGSVGSKVCNKNKVFEDLRKKNEKIALKRERLKKSFFKSVTDGGSFTGDENKKAEEKLKSKEDRIKRVQELTEKLDYKELPKGEDLLVEMWCSIQRLREHTSNLLINTHGR